MIDKVLANRVLWDADDGAPDIVVARQSLDESVADHLRSMIIRGELSPGDKLRLPELARELGVSTTPLREALKILAEEAIVEWTPGRGARVAPIRAEETGALFDVIASLEALAAELTAQRASAADFDELQMLHINMRACFERRERDPYFELNSRIHDRIFALAANPILQATRARLHVRASRGRYIAIVDETRWQEAMREHDELMRALVERDCARAHEIWRRHLINTGAAVRRAQLAETVEKAPQSF